MTKSIRTEPLNHAAEGDERIRTAVPSLGTDFAYERHSAAERTVIGEPVRSPFGAGLPRTAVSVKPGGAGA